MGFWGLLKESIGLSGDRIDPLRVDLEAVQDILGYGFRDPELVLLGLTHRSFTHGDQDDGSSNERMEFLGDSVLGLVIAEQLYVDFPGSREGELTKMKAMLVNETTLASVATRIGLHRQIRLSPEEDRSGGRDRPSIVSDAFESVLAAVYLDGGLGATRDVILRLIYARRDEVLSDSAQRNYKGELLELTQARGLGMPRYDVISESGPDHCKEFRVAARVGGKHIGEGTGASKKEAEQRAAAAAFTSFKRASDK